MVSLINLTGLLLFLDISGGEIIIILIAIFIVFGPQRIPELARKVGKGMNEIKRATNKIKDDISREVGDISDSVNEVKNIKDSVNINLNTDLKKTSNLTSPSNQDVKKKSKPTAKKGSPGEPKKKLTKDRTNKTQN